MYDVIMMDNNQSNKLELIGPLDIRLNHASSEVPINQIKSELFQGIIGRMIELSEGRGHKKDDSRQMVGLAAVQLGINLRIVSIDISADGSNKEQKLEIIVNPIITEQSVKRLEGREGCWSCGNICGNVERSSNVTIEGYDRRGMPVIHFFTGFVARIAQHELDHLDGIRFPDRIPKNHPERLHIVEPAEFEEYRTNWQDWPYLCSREQWESMKYDNQALSSDY